MKIALVYDRVNTPFGGAEKVLLALHELFPTAPLFTSVYDKNRAKWADVFTVKTSFLQRIPGAKRHHRLLAPCMTLAFEQFNFDTFDIIISVSSAEAKGVITKPNQLHICYLLTPTRYLYSHRTQYVQSIPFGLRTIAKAFLAYMHWSDQVTAYRPDIVIPISKLVSKRIASYYPKANVTDPLYPPIEIPKTQHVHSQLPIKPNSYLLCYGRLVAYKKFDLVIQAAIQLNIPLVVIGEGPDKKRLEAIAWSQRNNWPNLKNNILFLKHLNDSQLHTYITNARAVLFPAEEDFGISQAEVAFTGTPVIMHKKSGAAEIIGALPNCICITRTTIQAVTSAIMALDTLSPHANMKSNHLTKYDTKAFKKAFTQMLKAYRNKKTISKGNL